MNELELGFLTQLCVEPVVALNQGTRLTFGDYPQGLTQDRKSTKTTSNTSKQSD